MKSTIRILSIMVVAAACAPAPDMHKSLEDIQSAPHTGNPKTEAASVNANKEKAKASESYFVNTNKLNMRAAASTDAEITATLKLNDKVKITKRLGDNSEFVEIIVLSGRAQGKTGFVAFSFLDDSEQSGPVQTDDSLFIIQNVATERLRVYQKSCASGACKNKMIMETELVVGEDKAGTRTGVGNLRIAKWVKFYQDSGGLYPSWYDPNYPPMPNVGQGWQSWMKDNVMPGGRGSVRGAFGWYTALVGPNPSNQWTHGTIGWGAHKDKWIQKTRGFFANLFGDPRSHGCSRTDNESIAYLRQIIPVGTPMFKIYTQEKLYDASLSGYSKTPGTWKYILTKNGVRVDGQRADREEVISKGTPAAQYLEEGTFAIKQYPTADKFDDRYGIGKANYRGVYYVDVGLVDGYTHPVVPGKLDMVGTGEKTLPDYATYKLGAPLAASKNDSKKDVVKDDSDEKAAKKAKKEQEKAEKKAKEESEKASKQASNS